MGGPDQPLRISVLYALPDRQELVSLSVLPGSTAGEAIKLSGLAELFPDMGAQPALARFGKSIAWNTPLKNHDRVDILRPLLADPKDFRRRRAALQRRKFGKP